MIDTPKLRASEVGKQPRIGAGEKKRPYKSPVLLIYGLVSKLTAGGGSTQTDGIMTTQMSDRMLKENVIRIGTHPLGFGMYLFEFKPEFIAKLGSGRQFGVMADKVEQVMPQAVSVGSDGYKRVDYAMLGIHRHLQ